MRKATQFLIPPTIASLCWVIYLHYSLFRLRHFPPAFLGGHPDNAPYRAAYVLLFLTPVAFAGLAILHSICVALQGFSRRSILWTYLGALVLISFALTILTYSPSLGNRFLFGFAISLVFVALVVAPMAVTSWAVDRWLPSRSRFVGDLK